MNNIKTFFIVLITFLIIDFIWIGILSKKYWEDLVLSMTGKQMKVNVLAAIGAYLLLAIGVTFIVLPSVDSVQSALLNGALFGLVVYGVFDLTNLAIFSDYSVNLALADTLWGTFATSIITAISYTLTQ